jgi:hypothetical protein
MMETEMLLARQNLFSWLILMVPSMQMRWDLSSNLDWELGQKHAAEHALPHSL